MNAQHTSMVCLLLSLVIGVNQAITIERPVQSLNKQVVFRTKKIELFNGVYVKIPESNSTEKLLSLEIDTKKGLQSGRSNQKKLMQRILPLFIMPFLIQSTIVPFFLSMLKFMLFKSMMVGKVALALIIFNAFKNNNAFKAKQDAEIADVHYGYHGNDMEEYGAYVN